MLNYVWLFVTPMDYSSSGSSIHGFLQARILEWVAIPFSRESSWSRGQTSLSCIAGRFFTVWATREAIYIYIYIYICSVQSLSRVQLFATPWTAARQASLSSTNSQSLLKTMSIESVMLSNHPLSSPSPPSIFPSIRVFSSESVLCIRWLKNWSFSFSISPSNEYSGLISFWIDWFELLVVQRMLKSLLQHHSSKASILQHSAFFIVQLSYWYMTIEKKP